MFIKKVMLSTRSRCMERTDKLFNKGKTETKDSTIYAKKLEK